MFTCILHTHIFIDIDIDIDIYELLLLLSNEKGKKEEGTGEEEHSLYEGRKEASILRKGRAGQDPNSYLPVIGDQQC
jgi:hypothetical protein